MDRLNPAVLPAEFRREHADAGQLESSSASLQQERMPFTVRIVADDNGLEKAVQMRRLAYSRHLPDFAEKMAIERSDREPGTIVLLAESKLDGGPLGTMRIQTNEFAPLALEQSVTLPDWLRGTRLAEATRLGVAGGTIGRMVKIALCKALFMYCGQEQIDWMVITARSPLDREYEAMLFVDVFGKEEFLPMAHVGGLHHRVMAKPVAVARQRWAEVRHPLYRFVFQTSHPDIDLNPMHLSLEPETVRCPRDSEIAQPIRTR
ncbi:N-acyl amino acid synthase FeeM domain-containing protein [Paraburkholderia flava]|uniref:N-acyl amino acid synthase FeeM domain-containing protein n=1 Tax=Paraburkholderia flava TaxID=2547393 RepID=UPI001F0F82AD|nr:hypothetical protein [Paraburkholderia flava]